MNKKHIGSSIFDDVKRWEKESPDFRKSVREHIEKVKLAEMIKEIRQKENLSQLELAKMAHVTQSVIARIETNRSRTLPRLDLFRRIIQSAGYELSLVAKKEKKVVRVAF